MADWLTSIASAFISRLQSYGVEAKIVRTTRTIRLISFEDGRLFEIWVASFRTGSIVVIEPTESRTLLLHTGERGPSVGIAAVEVGDNPVDMAQVDGLVDSAIAYFYPERAAVDALLGESETGSKVEWYVSLFTKVLDKYGIAYSVEPTRTVNSRWVVIGETIFHFLCGNRKLFLSIDGGGIKQTDYEYLFVEQVDYLRHFDTMISTLYPERVAVHSVLGESGYDYTADKATVGLENYVRAMANSFSLYVKSMGRDAEMLLNTGNTAIIKFCGSRRIRFWVSTYIGRRITAELLNDRPRSDVRPGEFQYDGAVRDSVIIPDDVLHSVDSNLVDQFVSLLTVQIFPSETAASAVLNESSNAYHLPDSAKRNLDYIGDVCDSAGVTYRNIRINTGIWRVVVNGQPLASVYNNDGLIAIYHGAEQVYFGTNPEEEFPPSKLLAIIDPSGAADTAVIDEGEDLRYGKFKENSRIILNILDAHDVEYTSEDSQEKDLIIKTVGGVRIEIARDGHTDISGYPYNKFYWTGLNLRLLRVDDFLAAADPTGTANNAVLAEGFYDEVEHVDSYVERILNELSTSIISLGVSKPCISPSLRTIGFSSGRRIRLMVNSYSSGTISAEEPIDSSTVGLQPGNRRKTSVPLGHITVPPDESGKIDDELVNYFVSMIMAQMFPSETASKAVLDESVDVHAALPNANPCLIDLMDRTVNALTDIGVPVDRVRADGSGKNIANIPLDGLNEIRVSARLIGDCGVYAVVLYAVVLSRFIDGGGYSTIANDAADNLSMDDPDYAELADSLIHRFLSRAYPSQTASKAMLDEAQCLVRRALGIA